jgi:hypothetical protein
VPENDAHRTYRLPAQSLRPATDSGRLPAAEEKALSASKALAWVLVALVIAGVIIHLKILFSPAGTIDSDEAVMGLMAAHLKNGEISTFYWGQSYGGSHEALMAGVLFWLFGPSSLLLKLVPISLHALAAVLAWQVGRQIVSETAARIGGALVWIWPPFLVLWSTKVGIYMAAICIALLALFFLVKMTSREVWPIGQACLFGFFAGNAFWANPQVLYMLIPASVFFVRKFLRNWKRLPLIVICAGLGAFPWILYNVRTNGGSFNIPPQPGSTYLWNLKSLIQRMLPMLFGLRLPYTASWVPGALGIVIFIALILLIPLAIWKRPKEIRLFLFILLIYPFIYAFSPYSWFRDEPRYLLMLLPSISLMAGYAIARLFSARPSLRGWLAPAILVMSAGVIALSIPVINQMNRPEFQRPSYDVPVPVSFRSLGDLLEREKVEYAFSDYWIAYRATFEFDEKTIVEPYYTIRYKPYDEKIRSIDSPPWIFLADSALWPAFKTLADEQGIAIKSVRSGKWLLAFPNTAVSPEEFAAMTGH